MDRIALVIGNADYKFVKKLKNPINDANDIASILEKLNFKVTKKTNVTLNDTQALINNFLFELGDNATGLLYYAGHGMQIDGNNYIVPIDCQLLDKSQTIVSCFCLNEYINKLSVYKGKTNICILDACRDNPFAQGRGFASGFAEFHDQPKGTIIAYSTSTDCGASDGDGCNGLYTQVLKDVLQIPNIKIEEMFKTVRVKVAELSNDEQISWEHSSLVGDFYFSVTPISVDNNYTDIEIYDFIKERVSYYESHIEDIEDVECLPYVDAYRKYNIPIIKLLRAFSRVQYEKMGKRFSDATIDQLNFDYLRSWGFYQSEGRWYYKDNYVEMGDMLPLPPELSRPEPIVGQEINIGGRLKGWLNDGKLTFSLYSNIPEGTPIIFTLKKGKYVGQSSTTVRKNCTISEEFSKKGKGFWNGRYRLEITSPIHSVLPESIKQRFGDRNRNIVGKNVRFDPIGGKSIMMVFEFLLKEDKVFMIE